MQELRASDAAYPATLKELVRPPAVLHTEGDLRLLSARPCIAIVGSRQASERGRSLAWLLARDLARAGATVVSGGALGIDAAAHQGALEGASARCVVVLPSAIRDPRPASHRDLFREIVRSGGLLVSEYASTPPGRYAYCARNRIIAALAQVVVVVEARHKSGTQHTVREAKRLGRIVAAMPWSIGDSGGAGCLELLRSGARTVLCAADVLAQRELEGQGQGQGPAPVSVRSGRDARARKPTPLEWGRGQAGSGGAGSGAGDPSELGGSEVLQLDAGSGGARTREGRRTEGVRAAAGLLAILPPPTDPHTCPGVAPEWAARRLGVPLGKVLAWFSELELQGLVRPVGGGRYARRF